MTAGSTPPLSATAGTTVSSRLLAILACFDEGHRRLILTELSRGAGLPLSTTHRLVAELVQWGALRRRSTGEYVIGRRIWELGLLAPAQAGLRQLASPFLQDLYGATLATVHLAERDGLHAVYLDRVSGHTSVSVVSQIGSRLPLHATGVGKVLLAHAPPRVQRRALAQLQRVTAYTVTRPGLLRSELDAIVSQGWAQTSEEMSLGACSVAVPVLAPQGSVVAALGIVVPSLRRDRARHIAALQVAARGIGRSIATAATV